MSTDGTRLHSETLSPHKLSWRFVAVVVTLLLVAAIAFNAWNHRQQQSNIDVNTDRLVTELCADTPDC